MYQSDGVRSFGAGHSAPVAPQVREEHLRGVATWRTDDGAVGMGGGAGLVET